MGNMVSWKYKVREAMGRAQLLILEVLRDLPVLTHCPQRQLVPPVPRPYLCSVGGNQSLLSLALRSADTRVSAFSGVLK